MGHFMDLGKPDKVELAIRTLVNVWLADGHVELYHDAWLVLAHYIGKENDAKDVIAQRTCGTTR
jgi:prepilin-type processing-associated H-X9-DG protein